MADAFFRLPPTEQSEVLKVAAAKTGRPTHVLEKDIWVVWVLSVLFAHPVGRSLSFKGGTSLSKAWGVIDRFSEDIDLTYDIRAILPDLGVAEDGLPPSRSQGQKWTEEVRRRLPAWIDGTVSPILRSALAQDGMRANLRLEHHDRLYLEYRDQQDGYGYVKPAILLEFGARSTGEPTEDRLIACDASQSVPAISFPTATARAMKVERTFWEKATAAHVFCIQGQLKGERFARHWYDLAMIFGQPAFESAVGDRHLAKAVADHKSIFFRERGPDGGVVDYVAAVSGELRLVPNGAARKALAEDYRAMLSAGLVREGAPAFDALLEICRAIQDRANGAK